MNTISEAHIHAHMLRLIAQALRCHDPKRGARALEEAADQLDGLTQPTASEQAAQFVVDAWSSAGRSTR